MQKSRDYTLKSRLLNSLSTEADIGNIFICELQDMPGSLSPGIFLLYLFHSCELYVLFIVWFPLSVYKLHLARGLAYLIHTVPQAENTEPKYMFVKWWINETLSRSAPSQKFSMIFPLGE